MLVNEPMRKRFEMIAFETVASYSKENLVAPYIIYVRALLSNKTSGEEGKWAIFVSRSRVVTIHMWLLNT